jgi:hypothetical protein
LNLLVSFPREDKHDEISLALGGFWSSIPIEASCSRRAKAAAAA